MWSIAVGRALQLAGMYWRCSWQGCTEASAQLEQLALWVGDISNPYADILNKGLPCVTKSRTWNVRQESFWRPESKDAVCVPSLPSMSVLGSPYSLSPGLWFLDEV